MKDLKEFGVQELNSKELKETDGGILPLLVAGALVLIAGGCATKKEYNDCHPHRKKEE